MTESHTQKLVVELEIVNERGLHTRLATEVVKVARNYTSEIRLGVEGSEVDAKSVMGLLTLAAKKGVKVKLSVSGPDQEEAFKKLKEMIQNGFPGVQE